MIGYKNARSVATTFQSTSVLKSLNISDTGLHESGLLAFCGMLPQSVTNLDLSNNFTGKSPEAEEFALGLGTFINLTILMIL